MVLLWESASKINCALIQRPDYDGVHSSQMAFPGGKKELSDASLLETAFRETKEEIGVDKDHLTVIGSLTKLYIPPSNFMVYPYITYSKIIPEFLLDETEVAEVVPFDIVDLLLQKSTRQDAYVTIANGKKLKTPSFQIEGKTVWGATAAILSEFKDIIEEL